MTTDLLRSPLHDRHVALGAKLADFGGWEMPIEYGAPAAACCGSTPRCGRRSASSTSRTWARPRCAGPARREFVNACLTNDLGRIAPGQAQYTLCCDDATGGVVDDLIAYLFADDHVFLDAERGEHGRGGAPAGGRGAGRGRRSPTSTATYGVLAVQGPRSAELLGAARACRPSTTT